MYGPSRIQKKRGTLLTTTSVRWFGLHEKNIVRNIQQVEERNSTDNKSVLVYEPLDYNERRLFGK